MEGAEEQVVLVDDADRAIGAASKRAAHDAGLLHRAVSVFVGDGAGRVLLQRRALEKYHSGGLWTNTACGHPRPGELASDAASRRLWDEMGVRCALDRVGVFRYCAALEGGLVEHEIDHVFVGQWLGAPRVDPTEVAEWRWSSVGEITRELHTDPTRFTAWFAEAFAIAKPSLAARHITPGSSLFSTG
jgi:isopentenyl-diphosphate Delta-isomerase